MTRRVEFGDFQTPPSLAARVCGLLARQGVAPRSLVEPTCGEGSLLLAALEQFRPQTALGMDINPSYIRSLRRRVGGAASVRRADFFQQDWRGVFEDLRAPLLVVGNPPWVTNAVLTTIDGRNLPRKRNHQQHSGLDAVTGKANFDISEWMLSNLVTSLAGRRATLAMLCKTAVARRVLRDAWKNEIGISLAEVFRIDAQREFGAAVDACLLVIRLGKSQNCDCDVYESLESVQRSSSFGLRDGLLLADPQAYDRHSSYLGQSSFRWRSGIKHDCAKVMELTEDGALYNGFGETVDIEPATLFPLLKSSELASGKKVRPRRWMIVTQSKVGEETGRLQQDAPKTWRYLCHHGALLDSRRSRIYRNRPRFSLFGVGPYSFAPWKVAISSLYKRLDFLALGKYRGKPIVLDDTCYSVACKSRDEARRIEAALNAPAAQELLSAFVFWDAKRPITCSILQQLNLEKIAFEQPK